MNTPNINTMTNKEFKALVGNHIFGCDFLKKDGSVRTYNARVEVSKGTKGGSNPVEHKPEMCTVYEMDKGQQRTLNIRKIIRLTLEGETFYFNKEERV